MLVRTPDNCATSCAVNVCARANATHCGLKGTDNSVVLPAKCDVACDGRTCFSSVKCDNATENTDGVAACNGVAAWRHKAKSKAARCVCAGVICAGADSSPDNSDDNSANAAKCDGDNGKARAACEGATAKSAHNANKSGIKLLSVFARTRVVHVAFICLQL